MSNLRPPIDTRRMQPAPPNPLASVFVATVVVVGLSTYGYLLYRLIAEVFPL